jgi:hypothetical protein
MFIVALFRDDLRGLMIWGGLGVVFFIGGIIWHNGYEKKKKKQIKAMPLSSDTATVISKLHEKNVDGIAGMVDTTHAYYIVFELSDKSRKKFTVNKQQFAVVREDDKGILSYKQLENNELLFVDFQLQ